MSAGKFDLSAIGDAATLAQSIERKRTLLVRVRDLESQLGKIEPLLEQLQNNAQTATNLSNYISDLRAEQVFFNRARYVLAAAASIIILLLIILLWAAIWNSNSPLLKAPPAAVAAFILGIVSGIVFLINSFAKGVFRSTAERHADGFLPPAFETAFEVYKKVIDKG